MPEIFISYSRVNSDFVRKLVDHLEGLDRSLWVDWESIPWTADWWAEIRKGIETSDNFVFVLSPASLSSVVCALEVAHAIENNKRLIPIVYEEATLAVGQAELLTKKLDGIARSLLEGRDLKAISDENWQQIARHNWMFFNDDSKFEEAIGNLIDAVDTDLEHTREHTRLLSRAREWDEQSREASFLLDGAEIERSEQWLARASNKTPSPSKLHTEYIFASRANANRRQRLLLTGVSVALVVATALTILSGILWRTASAERDRADFQAQISESGRVALQGLLQLEDRQLDRALLLGLEALAVNDSIEANSSLLTSLQSAPQLTRYLHDHDDWVRATAYHPDGDQFATADSAGKVLLWDNTADPPTSQVLVGHERGVWDVAFSPDGLLLASADEGGNIILWDTTSGEIVRQWTSEPNIQIFSISFHPNGNMLASAAAEPLIRLWDVRDGSARGAFEGHSDWVSKVAFSDDGTLMASGGRASQIIVWDVDGWSLTQRHLIEGHTNWVFALDFNPDSTLFASGAADGTLRLWDVETGEIVGQPVADHLGWVRVVEFSADGSLLVSGSQDQQIILRDPTTGRRLRDVPPLTAHAGEVFDLSLRSEGTQMLSADQDGNLLLWDTNLRQPFSTEMNTLEGEIYDIAYSPDGSQMVVTSTAGTVTALDPATGAWVADAASEEREVVRAAYSPDGALLAYAVADGTVGLREAATDNWIAKIEANDGPTWDIAFHPSEPLLATVGTGNTVRFWNTGDGSLSDEFTLPTEADLQTVVFSRDGAVYVVGDTDGAIFVVNDGVQQTLEGHTDTITRLAFSNDGTLLASASRDNTAILWDTTTWTQVGLPLADHDNWVLDLAFNNDDTFLATGSRDATIILWDVATQRPIGLPFENRTGWVWSVAFAPDGTSLMTGSRGGELAAWSTGVDEWRQRACRVANRNLSSIEIDQFLTNPPGTLACSDIS
jgi:WD40 repeat protein